MIADIYILEEKWDCLLDFIQNSNLKREVEHYEQYLGKLYPNEISEMYAEYVKDYLIQNVGRKHYKSACRYLRRMIKLGNREMVNEIIDFLRTEYPSRRALMEELDNV